MKQAGVMLIIKDGLILGITRRNDKTKYGLPGGKVEPGETPKEAAIRETFEETSIRVKDCELIYDRVELGNGPKGFDLHSFCYYATSWEGEPQKSEEGEVAWLTAQELTSTKAAFASYNNQNISYFKTKYPDIFLKE